MPGKRSKAGVGDSENVWHRPRIEKVVRDRTSSRSGDLACGSSDHVAMDAALYGVLGVVEGRLILSVKGREVIGLLVFGRGASFSG